MSEGFCLIPSGAPDPLGRGVVVPRDANAGLVWARYLRMWEGTLESPLAPRIIKRVLEKFGDDFNSRASGARNPARDLLRLNRERQQRALDNWTETRGWSWTSLELSVVWRLVTGLGNPHPTQANLAFDPIIGVPFLTGTAVKGLCRSTAILGDAAETDMERLFGPESSSVERKPNQGKAVFFDAFPRRWPTLMVDVINCHHQAYYGERDIDNKVGPLETESPVPVNFLCIGEGAAFIFPIAAQSAADLDRVKKLLRDGLSTLGIGGKTAVGYGVFGEQQSPTDRR